MATQKITIKTHRKKLKEAREQGFKEGIEYGRKMGKDYIVKALRAILDVPSNKDIELHEQQHHDME